MAMEIIIQPSIDGNEFQEEKIVSSMMIEEELTTREKDSGHWSVDYTLPTPGDSRDRTDSLSGPRSPVSLSEDSSVRSYDVNADSNKNSMVASLEELTIVVVAESINEPTPAGIPNAPPPPPVGWTVYKSTSGVPVPPPLPSIGWTLHKFQSGERTIEELQITKPTKVEPPAAISEPPTIEPVDEPDVDESQCCIVCFDPNQRTEYEDFDYDMYLEVHRVINSHLNLPCCGRLICKPCIEGIISTVVGEGRVQISCPHPECAKPFTKEYILDNIKAHQDIKSKYQQFLVDVENDGKRKTCPKCCHITEYTIPRKFILKEQDLKIECEVCNLEWCFKCHAPWHANISCRQFQKGSKQFHKWTKGKQRGVANCQKCPTCRVYIQRSTGCHHMQCNRCDTEFCYDCGNRYLELGIIDHDSYLNVWGCPDNYHKDEPIIRETVRWGYLTAKLSYLAAYPPLLIGACGLLVIGAAVVVPIYIGFKIHSYSKFKQQNNRRRRRQ